ncbi:MAG: putative porin, partial [Flavitalea sp.]
MSNTRYIVFILLLFATGMSLNGYGQGAGGLMRRLPRGGGGAGKSGAGDSLQHRDAYADSITISFRYLDSTRMQKFDSSITDFSKRYPVPWQYIHLGNLGTPARSLIFSPLMKPGWDMGFHGFDIYNFTDNQTRFYNTTRPYSEFNYQLGSKLEQIIEVVHTQNILPNWNAAFQYKLITSPGSFQNQNVNHNNYRFSSWFQSKNKRYQNFLVIVGNKLQAGENGGIGVNRSFIDSIGFGDLSGLPTRMGQKTRSNGSFFSSNIETGSRYTTASYLFRQQYDLGQKDSIVTDSSVIPLFYPRLRLEHTINYKTFHYRFADNVADSSFYFPVYGIDTSGRFELREIWKQFSNDFSFYTFPDAKNSQQFFKAGASIDLLSAGLDSGYVKKNYHNFILHGEYRNKTRNQKWDIEAQGSFYVNGLNAGDYNAYISLRRLLSKKLGYLQVGFENVNRTPSFVYDTLSSFYMGSYVDFKKENTTQLFGTIDIPRQRVKLSGRYYLITNYSYFKTIKQPDQYSTLFNVLEVSAEKQFKLSKHWNWRTWVILQQKTGNAPLNIPLFFTRNQLGYDGKLGFKNLLISFGIEFRYYTPYKADGYSPLLGQYYNQNDTTIQMKFPELGGYLHFRIKTFTAYLRAENLNSLSLSTFKFTNLNTVTPY